MRRRLLALISHLLQLPLSRIGYQIILCVRREAILSIFVFLSEIFSKNKRNDDKCFRPQFVARL